MLRFLRIRDFALIRELEVEFGPGLNLLTGETGSGKSIIVDALSLLTGERSSTDIIRSNAASAILEAVFSIGADSGVSSLLLDAGIDFEEDTLLVRREISASGRSRIYMNNCPATLALLRSTGEKLVDIHGQHDRQSLLELSTHLAWLDRFGDNTALVEEIRERYRRLRKLSAELDASQLNEQERLRKQDVLRFQLEEIKRARLKDGEREQIRSERTILVNHERIMTLSSQGYDLLYESAPSLLNQVNRLAKIAQELGGLDPAWSAQRESIEEIAYRLDDIAIAIRDYISGISFSPERLNEIELRLEELDRLTKKYGNSVEEILKHAEGCERELDELSSWEDRYNVIASQFREELSQYLSRAGALSEKRRNDAAKLEREIRNEFRMLSMDRMVLGVHFERPEDEERAGGRIPAYCGPSGLDRLEFMVSPNKGEEMRPLTKIASGGELSRIMLAIKSICGGGEASKALVFDEVDAGIGGRVAEVVGRRLHRLSRTNQVFCVTHLPQIAAFADSHFRVEKKEVGSRTETSISPLGANQRIEEIARMLGGETITETTRQHAQEMLRHCANSNHIAAAK